MPTKPKLKLDLFSIDNHVPDAEQTDIPTVQAQTPKGDELHPPLCVKSMEPERVKSPIFIPVGFTKRELSALEHTVFQLRQKGHREVSKSALIRSLIRLHETSLDTIWLEEKERARTNKLAPNL